MEPEQLTQFNQLRIGSTGEGEDFHNLHEAESFLRTWQSCSLGINFVAQRILPWITFWMVAHVGHMKNKLFNRGSYNESTLGRSNHHIVCWGLRSKFNIHIHT
jgi:hypothetical protein